MNAVLRILLVEDNPGDEALIREMLAPTGSLRFNVKSVQRLSEALTWLKDNAIDIVLLDLGLPDSQGLNSLIKINEIKPETPIVVLTGLADEAIGTQAVKEGAQDYLLKGQIDKNLLARSINYAIERKRAGAALKESEARFRSLFENSPISLWEEDFTEVKKHIDHLRTSGVKDFRTYFQKHPEEVASCAARVRVVDINQATLQLYHAGDKSEFLAGLGQVFGKKSYEVFAEELTALAEGKAVFESEAVNNTLAGEEKTIFLKWLVAPGHEETLSKVFVSIIDITERKRAEEERQKLINELKDALAQIKTLSGMLPICASCKKIKDDKGYWNQVETYISEHTDTVFSHGMCPECAEKAMKEVEVFLKDGKQ